jgi:hypothetical protein
VLRTRLASKLALASIPIGLVALLAGGYVAWTFLDQAEVQRETAQASNVASAAMETLSTLWSEQHLINTLVLDPDGVDPVNLESARAQTDRAIAGLVFDIDVFAGVAQTTSDEFVGDLESIATSIEGWLADVRGAEEIDATLAGTYRTAGSLLFDVISTVNLNLNDRDKAQDVGAAEALAEAASISFAQEQLVRTFISRGTEQQRNQVESNLNVLEAELRSWQARAAASSDVAATELSDLAAMEEAVTGREASETVDINGFPADRNELLIVAADRLAERAAAAAQADSETARQRAILIAGGVAVIILLTIFATVRIERSLVRRVRAVTDSARRVAEVELPNLVSALRNPDESGAIPARTIVSSRIRDGGSDEVSELARSFSALHGTLVEVAAQQMDILRKGVSEIFVTLARRNSSLVDRQLALIDKLESKEEDPETLAGYYRLDHLSTRMRRNAESLLVLAGAESPRMWEKPLEIGDVIRAALGEVDEYQRIDILALEPVRVAGHAVADVAHLLSELLDNATQFSPPTERVRVAGLFDEHGYLITISDHGIGIGDERLLELNEMLAHPPVLGLALEPTLGMYVVARLASRHKMRIRLAAGVPGITVRITVPRNLLETAVLTRPVEPQKVQNQPAPMVDARRTRPSPPVPTPTGSGVSAAHPAGTQRIHPLPPPVETAPTPLATPRPSPATPPGNGGVPTARPAPILTEQGLPTRVPGTSFQDRPGEMASTSTSSDIGPEGIKAALSAFQTGRDSAGKLGDGPTKEKKGSDE